MKTRNGFVSNSSSSSFIIAYDDSHVCYACGGNFISEKFKEIKQLAEWINDGYLSGYYFNDLIFNEFNTFQVFMKYHQECWGDAVWTDEERNQINEKYKQIFGEKQCKTLYFSLNRNMRNMPLNIILSDFCQKYKDKIFFHYLSE